MHVPGSKRLTVSANATHDRNDDDNDDEWLRRGDSSFTSICMTRLDGWSSLIFSFA
jgi:hypothetical protein